MRFTSMADVEHVRPHLAGTRTIELLLASCFALFSLSGCWPSGDAPDEHAHNEGETTGTEVISNRIEIPEQVRRNLGITFAKVEMRKVASTLRMPGRFELKPSARREYHAPLAGKVELLVGQYDAVTTGMPLYRLDSTEWRALQQEIANAQAQVSSTSASVAMAKTASTGGVSATSLLQQRIAAGERHVANLRQSLETAQARLEQVNKLQQAVGGKLLELSDARSKVADARTALSQAEEEKAEIQREALRQSTEGGSALSSQANLAATLGARQAEYDAATLRLRVARASAASVLGLESPEELDKISEADAEPFWRKVDRIEVRATAPGVVQSLDATNGAYVDTTKLVLSVADPNQVRFRAVGLQSDLERLRDGMPAEIVPPASGGPGDEHERHDNLPGILTLGLEADADQRSLDIIVAPQGEVHWARPGVAAYLEAILDNTEEPVTAIPVASVIQDDLNKIVFRRDPADPDKAIRLPADLGISDGQWVALESGVMAGDEVVLGGIYQLKLAGGGKASEAGHFHADGTFHVGED